MVLKQKGKHISFNKNVPSMYLNRHRQYIPWELIVSATHFNNNMPYFETKLQLN